MKHYLLMLLLSLFTLMGSARSNKFLRVSDPDTIILAGEMLSDGFLLEQIRQKLQPVTMRFVTGGVVLTQLDAQNIGLLGAGALAIDGLERDAKCKK